MYTNNGDYMKYFKNILNGILIGIVNPIPGVSGGTIMMMLGIYEKVTLYINNLFSNKKIKMKELFYLLQVACGLLVGIVVFANILQILYKLYLPQTLFCFSGIILFCIPSLIKKEMPHKKFNYFYFILGFLIIFILYYFSKHTTLLYFSDDKVTMSILIQMFLIGTINGGATIFPGISGSMLLLVLGRYYIYNYYLSKINTFDINIIIPVIFIFLGILFGMILSSKISNYLLRKYKRKTMSLILGFIISSSIVILPFNYDFNILSLTTSILFFFTGGLITLLIAKNT